MENALPAGLSRSHISPVNAWTTLDHHYAPALRCRFHCSFLPDSFNLEKKNRPSTRGGSLWFPFTQHLCRLPKKQGGHFSRCEPAAKSGEARADFFEHRWRGTHAAGLDPPGRKRHGGRHEDPLAGPGSFCWPLCPMDREHFLSSWTLGAVGEIILMLNKQRASLLPEFLDFSHFWEKHSSGK